MTSFLFFIIPLIIITIINVIVTNVILPVLQIYLLLS